MEEQKQIIIAGQEIPLYSVINSPIELLKPSEYNPNNADEEGIQALANSIKQNPKWLIARPVVVNTYPGREYIIVAGEQRWRAAKSLGYTKIPVMFVYDDINQEKADNERDNIRPGVVDPVKEQLILSELRDSGFDMTGIGYTPMQMVDHMNLSGEDAGQAAAGNPENTGSTPAKELQCPNCGHIGKRRDFKKKE